MDIADKVVVITGAASGIGRAMAHRFAAERPRALVLLDYDEMGLQPVAQSVSGEAAHCDMRQERSVAARIADIEARHGHIDLFCGNAGILRMGGVETDRAEFQQVMDVNVMSHVFAAKAALPGMVARGEGYFLITASAAGLLTQLGSLSYSVSKHAAIAVAEWIAISYGHLGIKVSALCPQGVETPMTAHTDGGGVAGIDGLLSAESVADTVVEGLRKEAFLILPHPEVRQYFLNKSSDYDRWIGGMKKLQRQFAELMPALPGS